MIEFVAFLAFTILHHVFRAILDDQAYAATVNSTISLFIVFIIFTRFFLKICLNRVWSTQKRYPILCLFYFFMLIEGCLAVLFFGGDLQRPYAPWTYLTAASQVFMYGISTVMFVSVKWQDFSESRDLGKVYTAMHILDCLLIVFLLVCDLLIKPKHIVEDDWVLPIIESALFNTALVNILILQFRNYWLYKKSLMKKIENKIMLNQEKDLIDPQEKNLKTNKIMQDLIIVLDKSPIRVFEMNLVVKQLRDLLISYGRSIKESNRIAADFSSVIIINLMKRKNDFSYLPSFVVTKLQKYSKFKEENKRGQLC